jgi:hypothetical protein
MKMGSSTTIGFVYGSNSRTYAETELNNVTQYLISNNGKVLSQKYCKDLNGNGWVESNEIAYLLLSDTLNQLVNNYYGQLKIECDILGKKGLNLDILFKRIDQNNYGILLDIPDEQILSSNLQLDSVTNGIIALIQTIYKVSHFDYAFCDNEAQIEYSLPALRSIENCIYSLVAMPDEMNQSNLQIIKSSWHIDGLTPRKNN